MREVLKSFKDSNGNWIEVDRIDKSLMPTSKNEWLTIMVGAAVLLFGLILINMAVDAIFEVSALDRLSYWQGITRLQATGLVYLTLTILVFFLLVFIRSFLDYARTAPIYCEAVVSDKRRVGEHGRHWFTLESNQFHEGIFDSDDMDWYKRLRVDDRVKVKFSRLYTIDKFTKEISFSRDDNLEVMERL